jgi:hypothetical protein
MLWIFFSWGHVDVILWQCTTLFKLSAFSITQTSHGSSASACWWSCWTVWLWACIGHVWTTTVASPTGARYYRWVTTLLLCLNIAMSIDIQRKCLISGWISYGFVQNTLREDIIEALNKNRRNSTKIITRTRSGKVQIELISFRIDFSARLLWPRERTTLEKKIKLLVSPTDYWILSK